MSFRSAAVGGAESTVGVETKRSRPVSFRSAAVGGAESTVGVETKRSRPVSFRSAAVGGAESTVGVAQATRGVRGSTGVPLPLGYRATRPTGMSTR